MQHTQPWNSMLTQTSQPDVGAPVDPTISAFEERLPQREEVARQFAKHVLAKHFAKIVTQDTFLGFLRLVDARERLADDQTAAGFLVYQKFEVVLGKRSSFLKQPISDVTRNLLVKSNCLFYSSLPGPLLT